MNSQQILEIKKGTSLSQISKHLVDQKILDSAFLFKGILYLSGDWRNLKAGEYLIPTHVSPQKLIYILKSGHVVQHSLTLIEGETSHQLIQKLSEDNRFQGPCPVVPEGTLLPQTYHFPRNTDRAVIMTHLQNNMKQQLLATWAHRSPDLLLDSPEDLVIVASLVEKETSLPQERSVVAAVFLNRLKAGMPLQADPTVIYALTEGKGNLGKDLSREDLQFNSPYNTYLNAGLPPSPIANPGIASLQAVAHPASVDYLYFVADGKGGHVFATTLEEHQKNHARWREVRDTQKSRLAQ